MWAPEGRQDKRGKPQRPRSYRMKGSLEGEGESKSLEAMVALTGGKQEKRGKL